MIKEESLSSVRRITQYEHPKVILNNVIDGCANDYHLLVYEENKEFYDFWITNRENCILEEEKHLYTLLFRDIDTKKSLYMNNDGRIQDQFWLFEHDSKSQRPPYNVGTMCRVWLLKEHPKEEIKWVKLLNDGSMEVETTTSHYSVSANRLQTVIDITEYWNSSKYFIRIESFDEIHIVLIDSLEKSLNFYLNLNKIKEIAQ